MTNFIGHDNYYFHHRLVIGKRSVLKANFVLYFDGEEYKTGDIIFFRMFGACVSV